ncbi:hypothetical protein BHM03_00051683 [Ensete ventricosum]|nr:hypothetical protein BHM03_00051683 [Ensete ventricosum]
MQGLCGQTFALALATEELWQGKRERVVAKSSFISVHKTYRGETVMADFVHCNFTSLAGTRTTIESEAAHHCATVGRTHARTHARTDDTKREMEAITHASSTCCCYGVSTAAAVPKAFLTASIVFQPSMLFKRTFTFSSSRLLQTSLCPVSSSPTPFLIRNSSTTSGSPLPRPRLQSSPRQSSNLLRTSGGRSGSSNIGNKKISRPQQQKPVVVVKRRSEECVPSLEEASISVRTLYQNGDPLGRRELGKCVVRWISQGMHSMASDFASAEVQGEFSELRQRVGLPTIGGTPADGGAGAAAVGGLAFVIQAQPYLYAVPMPKGLEALCFKACTHYPTLFDHFQRELRNVLQDLQCQAIFSDWRATESWKLLKDIANSGLTC